MVKICPLVCEEKVVQLAAEGRLYILAPCQFRYPISYQTPCIHAWINVEVVPRVEAKHTPRLPFATSRLDVLELTNCDFKPPLKFNGYSMLKSLKLSNVTIASNLLQTLLSSCPLLMDLYLHKHGCQDYFRGNKFTFVEFLQCVPSIRISDISSFYMKYLGAGGVPEKLPTSLVHLKYLYLDICLTEQDSISSIFCLLRSSPNLEKISLRILNNMPKAKLPDTDSDSNLESDSDYDSDLDIDSGSYANSFPDANSVGNLFDSDSNLESDSDYDSDYDSDLDIDSG
ncbi:F-box/FBD/LRR-repeat protein-like protein [Tanacetum coccineum]